MPDIPGPDDPSISTEDMETPEQREAKAARLAEFRKLSDPTMEGYWINGVETPFGIPHDEVVEKVSTRRFEAVEAAELQYDKDFLGDVQEVVARINEVSGQMFYLGTYPTWALEHQITLARGEDSPIDPIQVAYITQQFEEHFPKAFGMTLQEWATNYAKSHPDQKFNPEKEKEFFELLDKDHSSHQISLSNLTPIFREWAGQNGIDNLDPQIAIGLLNERKFVAPAEWNDEVAATQDGKEILEAIQKIKVKVHSDEIASVLIGIYEQQEPGERSGKVISVGDVLAVASVEGPASENWSDYDDVSKEIIKAAMKTLADQLGTKVKYKKGDPFIKFE